MKYPNIAAVRVLRGLTRDDLARELHVTQETIHDWEELGNIPASSVGKLADFFGVSADYLLGRAAAEMCQVPDCIDADFAMICKGNDMTSARIYDGDIVYLKQTLDILDGDIAAVVVSDRKSARLARIRFPKEGGIELADDLHTFGERYAYDEIKFIAKAVAFSAPLTYDRSGKAVWAKIPSHTMREKTQTGVEGYTD